MQMWPERQNFYHWVKGTINVYSWENLQTAALKCWKMSWFLVYIYIYIGLRCLFTMLLYWSISHWNWGTQTHLNNYVQNIPGNPRGNRGNTRNISTEHSTRGAMTRTKRTFGVFWRLWESIISPTILYRNWKQARGFWLTWMLIYQTG